MTTQDIFVLLALVIGAVGMVILIYAITEALS